MNAHGSRAVGIFDSSSLVTVVPVPIFLVSITGVSASTVTVSATPATFAAKATSTLTPAFTITVRCVVAKPGRATETVYVAGSRPMKRNSPPGPEVVVLAPVLVPVRVMVTPGSTADCSSVTLP